MATYVIELINTTMLPAAILGVSIDPRVYQGLTIAPNNQSPVLDGGWKVPSKKGDWVIGLDSGPATVWDAKNGDIRWARWNERSNAWDSDKRLVEAGNRQDIALTIQVNNLTAVSRPRTGRPPD